MKHRSSIVLSIVMIPVACVIALPFYYIVVNTLKTQNETLDSPLGLPHSISISNYIAVFQQTPVVRTFFNTAYVTVLSIGLMLLIGSLAAFAVVMGRGRMATILAAFSRLRLRCPCKPH